MNRCSHCQAVGAASDQFCGNCGALLAPTVPPYPNYPPSWGPRKDYTGLVVVVVIIVVLVVVVLPAVLYVLVSSVISYSPPVPRVLGVTVSPSSDGSTWILTFTNVPAGLTQNSTTLTMISPGGGTLLSATTLFRLEGTGVSGVRYIPYLTGPSSTLCAPGDRILAAMGSGTGQYPPGSQAELVSGTNLLYVGTLQ